MLSIHLSETLIMVSLRLHAHLLAVLVRLQNLIVETLLQILEDLCKTFHELRLNRGLVATGICHGLLWR